MIDAEKLRSEFPMLVAGDKERIILPEDPVLEVLGADDVSSVDGTGEFF